ncbi:hypothetical protein SNOG_02164 [Parastagonospora nodorum SN15]|uniref:Uncharacterized protein n=1 Tax=Phaeosphaeria nodorum (strain SN15 / ATCC MYA-4574 / FGSC 10173) TaxID=321614 RepID=Q0V1F0_PHANO|nr:hypothetical protein SNOG_02164 [Parastagonospora nodorum SN15]EAT90376.1 hypothetical protein SNOG_02164 [Parastagonospora nodorum SN15]
MRRMLPRENTIDTWNGMNDTRFHRARSKTLHLGPCSALYGSIWNSIQDLKTEIKPTRTTQHKPQLILYIPTRFRYQLNDHLFPASNPSSAYKPPNQPCHGKSRIGEVTHRSTDRDEAEAAIFLICKCQGFAQ